MTSRTTDTHNLRPPAEATSLVAIRQHVRTLLDRIVGYAEVLPQKPGDPTTELVATAVKDVSAMAGSIGWALDAPRLNGRQLENLGQRLQELGRYVGKRAAELIDLTRTRGHDELVQDLERLRSASDKLLPLAEALIASHDVLAAQDVPLPAAPPAPAATARKPSPEVEAPASTDDVILVVDDNEDNRDLLGRRMKREAYRVLQAANGREALELLRVERVDLVFLDIMMPEIDGFGVLQEIKRTPALCDIPVIMISAVDDVTQVATCIEQGATDYLPKPFDPVILRARTRACLERKRLRDAEKRRTEELEIALAAVEKHRSIAEHLLMNILPKPIAEELREKDSVDPMYFEDVTIAFTDFIGFTLSTEKLSAEELVYLVHDYFTAFDTIVDRYGLEKMKTIGDSYMFAGGLPVRSPSHPVDVVMAAFDMLDFVTRMRESGTGPGWGIRIGIHTGPVIAGVVGIRKFAFDIWGDSVNFASRMESSGLANRINISERAYARVKDFFACELRPNVHTKDNKEVDTYLVNSALPNLMAGGTVPPPGFARRYRIYFKREPTSFPACLLQAPQAAAPDPPSGG